MHQLITLPNGVRLLTEEIQSVRSASLGFFVGVGSRHETLEAHGAAHFIEHMLFKGTETRSARQLAMDMDAIGGQFNAYTTKEQTCFVARCLDEHLNIAMDILSDMFFHSCFAQKDVEMERGVILEEIGMYEDSPEDLVSERMAAVIYGDSPLGRPILGTESSLARMTGDFLRQWQKDHYLPSRIVVALTGSFTQEHVDRLISLFGAMEPGTPEPEEPALYRPALTIRKKDIEQNHLLLGFPASSFLSPRRPQMQLLTAILGGGGSSRLFQELREQLGLCYTVYSYLADHADTGFLGIYAAAGPEQEVAALDALRRVSLDLAEHGPSQEELVRNREQAKASFVMGMESVSARMSHIGTSALLYNRVQTMDEVIEELNAVTREQIRDLAQETLQMAKASLSVVGHTRDLEVYQEWMNS